MESLQVMVGELRGKVESIEKGVASINKKVDGLVATENQRKGGWKVLVGVSAVVSGGVSFLMSVLKG
jgi:hypothetical protein